MIYGAIIIAATALLIVGVTFLAKVYLGEHKQR